MTKLLITTSQFQSFPKLREHFRVGAVVGHCAEHIIDDEGRCTHIVMDEAEHNFCKEDRSDNRQLLQAFGIVECPHIKDKFCDIQFEDGSHCEGCVEKIEYANRIFAQTQAKYLCPLMRDGRISTCWEGCNIEGSYLRDTCIACCNKAADERGWESSSRALTYLDVNEHVFRLICEQFIMHLGIRADLALSYDDTLEEQLYIAEDYRVFVDMMTMAGCRMGYKVNALEMRINKSLKQVMKAYNALHY